MPPSSPPRRPRVSPPVVWQLLGLALSAAGLYLLAGPAWALLAGGLALTAWGVAGELAGIATATRGRRRSSGTAAE